jgi:hypothetical protein
MHFEVSILGSLIVLDIFFEKLKIELYGCAFGAYYVLIDSIGDQNFYDAFELA